MQKPSIEIKKILIIHLVSNGDCLYTTAIARQIKKDYPGSHLTWIVSNLCSQVLLNNPHVDDIQIIHVSNVKNALFSEWYTLIERLEANGIFNNFQKIYRTQFFPENLHNYDGTIRSTLLRGYSDFRKMDVTPCLRLTAQEVSNVRAFAAKYDLDRFKKVVLFECSPGSGQSFVNPEFAIQLSEQLLRLESDMLVILSTHLPLKTNHERIVVGNTLTFRENAELANYCNLLIGCSSGITWLSTSDWLKTSLPMIQLLKKAHGISFASVCYDFDYWGLDSSKITEIFNPDIARITECVQLFFNEGMKASKAKFHEKVSPNPFYIKEYFNMLAKKRKVKPLFELFQNFTERNGFSFKLVIAFFYIWFQGVLRIPFVLVRAGKLRN
jgi:hypothetical protein